MTTPPSATSGKPGRRSEKPAERLARLEREMDLAKQAVAQAEKYKFEVLGRALWAEGEQDPQFKLRLQHALQRHVQSKTAKAAVEPLLASPTSDARSAA